MDKTITRDAERAARVKKVARKLGYAEDTVDAVIRDDRRNEAIMAEYMGLVELEKAWENNTLLQAVMELVPF